MKINELSPLQVVQFAHSLMKGGGVSASLRAIAPDDTAHMSPAELSVYASRLKQSQVVKVAMHMLADKYPELAVKK